MSRPFCVGQFGSLLSCFFGFGAGFEAVTVVTGRKDVTAVCETVEQYGCHLYITEDLRPFREVEVGCDEDTGALAEFAQQLTQQRAAGCAERQVSQRVQDHEIDLGYHHCLDLARNCSGSLTWYFAAKQSLDKMLEKTEHRSDGVLAYVGVQGARETQMICGPFAFTSGTRHLIFEHLPFAAPAGLQ